MSSSTNPITVKLRSAFTTLKHMIAPIPDADLALLRHEPMAGNEELQFWDDLAHLWDLKNAVTDEIIAGAFVFEVPPPVFSEKRWAELRVLLDADVMRFANIFEAA